MKKPILIVSTPNNCNNDKEKQELENELKNNEMFKDFEIAIFWGCQAQIYYPPNIDKE